MVLLCSLKSIFLQYGKHFDLTEINPNFATLGASFDWANFPEVTNISNLVPTLDQAFAVGKSAIFSVKVDTNQNIHILCSACIRACVCA